MQLQPTKQVQSNKHHRLTKVLMTLIFLGLWLVVQLGFNNLVNSLGLAGLEQWGLRVFQLVAGLVTLAPIAGYYVIDRRLAAFPNSRLPDILARSARVKGLKLYSQRLLIVALLALIFFVCLGSYLFLRQNPTAVLVGLFTASLLVPAVPVMLILFQIIKGRFNDRLPDLRRLDLSYNKDLVEIDLSRQDLKQAHLAGANLSKAVLRAINLERADLNKATLTEADLSGACLAGADLREAKLNKARLAGANLRGASLVGAELREANLEGVFLDGADLRQAYLEQAMLSGAILNKAQLGGAYLIKANLSQAMLISADLSQGWLSKADLSQALLLSAGLQEANLASSDGFCGYLNYWRYPPIEAEMSRLCNQLS